MTTEEAIEHRRAEPEYDLLIREAYLGADTVEASDRFRESAEFEESGRLLGGFAGRAVLDLGAGTGIASLALSKSGARRVYALEPDPSDVVGRGAIERLGDERIEVVDGVGEDIPLPDESIDIAYGRQVLHHTRDLAAVGREVFRVLKPGGRFLACREHVVSGPEELETFLSQHAVHQLAGGESAYELHEYLDGIGASGLRLRKALGLHESVINYFPYVRSEKERKAFLREQLGMPLYALGRVARVLPLASSRVAERLHPYSAPGPMHTFLWEKPGSRRLGLRPGRRGE
jgi:SAM-dependent methyltransferase